MVMVLVGIGAGLGLEHGIERSQPGAEAAQHLFQHVIAPDAQSIANYLDIGVAIADLPRQPGELLRTLGRDLDERLALAGNAHDGAIVEQETIAVMQRGRLRQIQQDLCAAPPRQHDAANMAFVGSEFHAIYHTSFVDRVRATYGRYAR
jgi:hypothetical protein